VAGVVRTPKPFTARQERFGRWFTKRMARFNIWVYHKSNGRFGARVGAAPICLLTTTGRRSGVARTVPLLYLEQLNDDRIVVVASQGGMSTNPEWYLNLVAEPKVTVEIGGDARAMVARDASAEERAQLWPLLVAMYPGYDTYRQRTTREIPIVICTPGV